MFCHAHLVLYWTLSSSFLDGTAVFSVRWRFRAEGFSHVARHRASGVSFVYLFHRNLGIWFVPAPVLRVAALSVNEMGVSPCFMELCYGSEANQPDVGQLENKQGGRTEGSWI